MRAGELRHKIRIEQNAPTRNNFGELIDAWTEFATVRAKKTALSGSEFFQAASTHDRQVWRFEIRRLAGLEPAMRIVDVNTSEIYDIESAIPKGVRQEDIEIVAIITDGET